MPKSNETATPECTTRSRSVHTSFISNAVPFPVTRLDDWLQAEAELSSAAATSR